MASVVGLNENLQIRSYISSLGLNPSNCFYQTIRSQNASTNAVQWQITSPDKRSMLLSLAQVEWIPTYRRVNSDDQTAEPFPAAADQFSFKPLLPFTQSMTSQTVSVNGQSLTFSQPRRFIESYARCLVSQSESKGLYESTWWDASGGSFCNNRVACESQASYIDQGLKANEINMKGKLSDGPFNAAPDVVPVPIKGVSEFTVSYFEPLLIPPFNPFLRCTDHQPDWAASKYQSPVIPNIDRLEIDAQFNPQKLAAGTLFYRYAQSTNANQTPKDLIMTNLNANLHLYWYSVPTTFAIPRSVDCQSWNIREFVSPVDGGTPVANGTIAGNVTTTDLLQLRSPPDLILMHAQRRQDVNDYVCRSMVADENYLGLNQTGSADDIGAVIANPTHSLDTFAEIVSVQVILGDRPNVISANFTQRELYDLTVKNCKYYGFSQDFETWKGPYALHTSCPNPDVLDEIAAPTSLAGGNAEGELQIQLSKAFVALRPSDLAEKVSSGVYFPTSLQFQVQFRNRDGAAGLAGGDHAFDLFTHVISSKNFVRIEPDRAGYHQQSVSYGSYENSVAPAMGATRPNDGLTGLREKADGGYSSRV